MYARCTFIDDEGLCAAVDCQAERNIPPEDRQIIMSQPSSLILFSFQQYDKMAEDIGVSLRQRFDARHSLSNYFYICGTM